MRTKTIKLYKYDELSDDAKEQAYEHWLSSGPEYPWHEENKNSLQEFEKYFPVVIKNWSYGGNNDEITAITNIADNINELRGVRLRTYIINNYGDVLYKPKYLGLVKGTSVYSKMQEQEKNCNLTGYISDEYLLEPLYKFIINPNEQESLEDILRDCLESWVSGCREDYEACQSQEYFADHAQANEYEYTKDGEPN